MLSPRPAARSSFVLVLALAASALAADPPESARELFGRLRAPCCYKQTLDIHASPLANEVRAEIEKRIAAGEPADAIEASLVARYGEKIRALPRRGFMDVYGIGLLIVSLAAAVFLVVRGRHWARHQAAAGPAKAEPAAAPVSDEARRKLAADLEELS